LLWSEQTGTAKTTLIHLIAKDLVLAMKGIRKMRYLQSVEMFQELKKSFQGGGTSESDVLDSILQADVFFLDDFDKLIRWSAYERETGTLILDKCYRNMTPVIMTANKSLEQMKEDREVRLEPHLYSRLVQMCKEVHLDDVKDFRIVNKIKAPMKEKSERTFVK
jgi:DNA replication protein DnaC